MTMPVFEKHDGPSNRGPQDTLVLNCTDTPLHHWRGNIEGLSLDINVNQCNCEPEFLVRNDQLFIGAEQGIFIIDLSSGLIRNQILDVSHVQWFADGDQNHVIVAAEDELIGLDNFGQLQLRENFPDVIESIKFEAGKMQVLDMSGIGYEFDLKIEK